MPESLIDSPLIIFSANICLSRINFSPKTVRRGTAATRERKRSTTLHADRQERTETEVNNFSVVVETRWKATSKAATFRRWREMFFVCTWCGWTRKISIKNFQYRQWEIVFRGFSAASSKFESQRKSKPLSRENERSRFAQDRRREDFKDRESDQPLLRVSFYVFQHS